MRYAWEDSYPSGLRWSLPLPDAAPLQEVLGTAAARWPERVAIDFYDCQISYRELNDLARRAAHGLQSLGVRAGTNVGLQLDNTPHFIVSFFAVLYAGGTVVNFNPQARSSELASQLADSEVAVLITGDWLGEFALTRQQVAARGIRLVGCSLADFLPQPAAAALVDRAVRDWTASESETRFSALITECGELLAVADERLTDKVAVIQYTGGTTGEPKGAMLTHANFSAVLHTMLIFTGGQFDQTQYKVLCVLPMWHIFGLTFMMLRPVATGTQIVLHLRFDAGRILSDIETKAITAFSGVPAMYAALVQHSDFPTRDLSSVLSWTSGGAPFPAELRASFERRARVDIHEGYAMTETTGIAVQALSRDRLATFCVGLPVPNTLIEIVDLETGTELLLPGQRGEICVSGPQVMKGYWKRRQENITAFSGGRLHTGDIGFLDDKGFLTVLDRKKDMILVGGHSVYPRTVERALCEHPDVAEAAVVGVPDPNFGEVGHACIVLHPCRRPPSRQSMYSFLAGKLSPEEIPMTFECVDELPKTAAGKVRKLEITARLKSDRASRSVELPKAREHRAP